MSNEEQDISEQERSKLLLEIGQLQSEIRRRLLVLVEHEDISDEFKRSAEIKRWIE